MHRIMCIPKIYKFQAWLRGISPRFALVSDEHWLQDLRLRETQAKFTRRAEAKIAKRCYKCGEYANDLSSAGTSRKKETALALLKARR